MLQIILILLCVLGHSKLTEGKGLANDSWINNERKLWHYLMDGYEKSVRPVQNENDVVNVTIGMSLQSIIELDEERNVLYTFVWMNYDWKDMQFTWDVKQFGGVRSMTFDIEQIWNPDIMLYNSFGIQQASLDKTQAVVYSDGTVSWVPQAELATICAVDLTRFPYDTQTCVIKFGSWAYDGSKIGLIERSSIVDLSTYTDHSLFELTGFSWKVHIFKYDCCPEPYHDASATLTLKRRTSATTSIFMAPPVIFCLLLPFIFLLPPESKEKIKFGMGLLISNVLVLLILIDTVPTSHLSTPSIGLYSLVNIILVSISLALSVLVMNIWSKGSRCTRMPNLIKSVVLGVFGRLLCVKRDEFMHFNENETTQKMKNLETLPEGQSTPPVQDNADDEGILKKSLQASCEAEWRQLAVIIDRLCFVIFLAVDVIYTIVMATK